MSGGKPDLPENGDEAREVLAGRQFFVPLEELPSDTTVLRDQVRTVHVALARVSRRLEHSAAVLQGKRDPDSEFEQPEHLGTAEQLLEGKSFFRPLSTLPDDQETLRQYLQVLYLQLARAISAVEHNERAHPKLRQQATHPPGVLPGSDETTAAQGAGAADGTGSEDDADGDDAEERSLGSAARRLWPGGDSGESTDDDPPVSGDADTTGPADRRDDTADEPDTDTTRSSPGADRPADDAEPVDERPSGGETAGDERRQQTGASPAETTAGGESEQGTTDDGHRDGATEENEKRVTAGGDGPNDTAGKSDEQTTGDEGPDDTAEENDEQATGDEGPDDTAGENDEQATGDEAPDDTAGENDEQMTGDEGPDDTAGENDEQITGDEGPDDTAGESDEQMTGDEAPDDTAEENDEQMTGDEGPDDTAGENDEQATDDETPDDTAGESDEQATAGVAGGGDRTDESASRSGGTGDGSRPRGSDESDDDPSDDDEDGQTRRKVLFGGIAGLFLTFVAGVAALLAMDDGGDSGDGGSGDDGSFPATSGDDETTDTGPDDTALELGEVKADAEEPAQEYVELTYTGEGELDISGYLLYDRSDGRVGPESPSDPFAFPPDTVLSSGETVRVYTGEGDGGDGEIYWGFGRFIWNQGGDTVIVQNTEGEEVLRAEYGG